MNPSILINTSHSRFSSSDETDYDEISTCSSGSSSSGASTASMESMGHGVKVPRMDRLVSILPLSVVQRLRSQKWRNWIAKVRQSQPFVNVPSLFDPSTVFS